MCSDGHWCNSNMWLLCFQQRYCLIKDGGSFLVPKSPLLGDTEDDPSKYEQDMGSEEAVMETYVAVLTAFVNISILKMNQVWP